MRWEDERYVRFYTRDTPEWLALSWHARGLLGLVLRVADRAGVLQAGKLGEKGVAVAVHAPWAQIEAPLRELLADGCLVWDEARAAFLIPNYLEAQECAQSDVARKRASRERARAQFGGSVAASENAAQVGRERQSQIVTKKTKMVADDDKISERASNLSATYDEPLSQNVTTGGHETGHVGVTIGHERSRTVTPTRAVPCREDQKPCRTAEVISPSAPAAPGPCDRVFAFWQEHLDHPHAVLDAKRRRLIRARLAEGTSADQLCDAIRGCKLDPFSMGKNDRAQRYDDIALICRDASHVEKFLQLSVTAPPKNGSHRKAQPWEEHSRELAKIMSARPPT